MDSGKIETSPPSLSMVSLKEDFKINRFCVSPRKHDFLSLEVFYVFKSHYLSSFITWSLITDTCILIAYRKKIFSLFFFLDVDVYQGCRVLITTFNCCIINLKNKHKETSNHFHSASDLIELPASFPSSNTQPYLSSLDLRSCGIGGLDMNVSWESSVCLQAFSFLAPYCKPKGQLCLGRSEGRGRVVVPHLLCPIPSASPFTL